MPQGFPEKSPVEGIFERLNNPRPVMEAIGALVVAEAELAFEAKRLGDFKWPAQYSNAPSPWLHVAGIASDLHKGEQIKETRFAPADTLKDSGDMYRSLGVKWTGRNEVQVGTTVPYAKYHQWGSDKVGPSVQPVTDAMRKGLSRAIKRDRKHGEALGKLWNWFRKDHIETRVQQRPFLGITPELEKQIKSAVEGYMQEGIL